MKIFKTKIKHPDKRNIYAITTGDYVGEMFIFIKSDETTHRFLSIPKNINRAVPKEKFEFGLKADIIEYIERIPRGVYKIVTAQYNHNENSNNRWEQSNSPNVLDSEKPINEN